MLSSQNQTSSYAKITNKSNKLTKECAIVIPKIENIEWWNLEAEYVNAIGSKIDPANIVAIFPSSQNRVICYLKNKDLPKEFVTENPFLTIQGTQLPTRCYISPSKRLFIYGVHPVIDNTDIADALRSLGIKIVSEVTDIKIKTLDPRYKHICTSKRQVYVDPEDNTLIPEKIEIVAEGESFNLYINVDENKCKLCSSTSHSTQRCKQAANFENINDSEEITKNAAPNPLPQTPASSLLDVTPLNAPTQDIIDLVDNIPDLDELETPLPLPDGKRTHSKTESSDESTDTIPIKIFVLDESIEANCEEPISAADQHEKISQIMKRNPEHYAISHDQFITFINSIKPKSNICQIAKTLSLNVEDLVYTIKKLYPDVDSNYKNKLSRIKKALTTKTPQPVSTEDST